MTAVSQSGHALQHAAEATVWGELDFAWMNIWLDINDPTHIDENGADACPVEGNCICYPPWDSLLTQHHGSNPCRSSSR